MRSVRLIITGRVQGVGYRAWFEREARTRGLAGWVRNRRDGSVEALVAGDDAAIEALVAVSRKGPQAARISDIEVEQATPPPLGGGFSVLPTD